MKRLISYLLAAAALAGVSCIKNDIPYPTVEVAINEIRGEGFTVASIDLTTRTVTLTLDEATDIQNVRIDSVAYAVTPHNTNIDRQTFLDNIRPSRELVGTFDLRTPIYVTLHLYTDYDWQITAEQTITRSFRVEGQVGTTEFDLKNRIATAYVAKEADRSRVKITELKLGPADTETVKTTYSPTMEELSTLDYSLPNAGDPTLGTPHFVDVTCHGRTERWVLYVLPTDRTVTTEAVDAWSGVVWLRASGVEGQQMGFRYRVGTDGAWNEVPDVKIDGGSFSAAFEAEPLTTYQFKSYCGDDESDPTTVTTERVEQLPNSGMEDWSKPGNPWLPFLSDQSGKGIEPFWGSGNNGAVTLGDKYNVTTPDETQTRPGTSGTKSAKLATTNVLVKLAAGNLFTGEFAATKGTNGIVNFGRPFALRPTALRVWVKYNRGNITQLGSNMPAGENLKKGDPDNGSIYIALGTWTKEKYGMGKDGAGNDSNGGQPFGSDNCPVSIDTRDVKTFFNPQGEDVIGYGAKIFTESVNEWTQITIPIDYRSTDRKPTHLMVVCSASRWGDYFIGSDQSVMWVDDFELIYTPVTGSN